MMQLYTRRSDLFRTEEEFMASRSRALNDQSRLLMKKWRKLIPLNGITDSLKANPNGTLSDGNARHIIASEQAKKERLIYDCPSSHWDYLPIDLNWLMGMQYFPRTQILTMRANMINLFLSELESKRAIHPQLKRPFIDEQIPVPGFDHLLSFSLAKEYKIR